MKAILYAGAVLMAGASIYGFIDYKNSSRNKAFKNLYNTTETPVLTEVKEPPAETNSSVIKKEATATKKSNTVTADNKTSVIATEEKTKVIATKMTTNPVEPLKTEFASTVKLTPKPSSVKRRKVISTKLFSRAALDERINKDVKTEKTEKTEKRKE